MSTLDRLELQRELLALMETLVDVMFCIKSIDGTYLAVNSAFVRRTGRTSKREVIGSTAAELFVADLADRYEEQDLKVFRTGEPLRDELELIRRPSGELGWYLTTKRPVMGRDEPAEIAALVSVSRDLRTPTSESITLASLQQIVAYVRANIGDTIRVAELATIAECSVEQLERRIRKVFGVTTKQYILRVQVDRAAELLTETDRALAEIATAVEFYDQSDFTRRFARLTDSTPAQFRAITR